MRNNEIKKNYLKKIKEITKLNESYYDKNSPLVLDSEYDLLKDEILNLEKKFKFLNHENSPSKIFGFNSFGALSCKNKCNSFVYDENSVEDGVFGRSTHVTNVRGSVFTFKNKMLTGRNTHFHADIHIFCKCT